MAYKKSPRKITGHQFAKGTTIDGGRLDDCMEDISSRWNEVPGGDIEPRWTQTVFHAGWQPKGLPYPGPAFTWKHHYPWLTVKNSIAGGNNWLAVATDDSLTTAPDSVQNVYRLKGYANNNNNAVVPGSADDEYPDLNRFGWRRAATTALYFSRPAIITQMSMLIRADGADSILGTNRPYQYTYSAALDAVHGAVLLDVDDPTNTEDRSLNTKEFARSQYAFRALPFNEHASSVFVANTFPDMFPSVHATGTMPYGRPDGIAMVEETNIPLPADSRVRFTVVIEDQRGSHVPFYKPYSLTIHALEMVE